MTATSTSYSPSSDPQSAASATAGGPAVPNKLPAAAGRLIRALRGWGRRLKDTRAATNAGLTGWRTDGDALLLHA